MIDGFRDEDASDASGIGAASAAGDAPAAAPLPQPTTVSWAGGTGDWTDGAQWSGGRAPQPGDAAVIGSGTAILRGAEAPDAGTFDTNAVQLGSGATLDVAGATVGADFSVAVTGSATVLATGTSVFAGKLAASASDGGTLTLASTPDATGAGDLVLARGAAITVAPNETLAFSGNVTLDGVASLFTAAANGSGGTTLPAGAVVNDGTVTLVGLANAGAPYGIKGAITGNGSFDVGLGSNFNTSGAVGAGETIAFQGPGASFGVGDVADFRGQVTGFAPGDVVDLTRTAFQNGATARYDAAAATLTVSEGGQTVATLANVHGTAGAVVATADGTGGTRIGFASAAPAATYELAASSEAMRADVAREMTTAGTAPGAAPGGGAPITGAGVKIGIISTSFDEVAPGSADLDARAGYLPYNPTTGGSAVHVLRDDPGTATSAFVPDDEGRAMAEEVYQVAPGAQIDFASAGTVTNGREVNSEATMADAVNLLKADGCNVIVDDIPYFQTARYQTTGTLDTAVSGFLSGGGSYFSSAGNEGHQFYAGSFQPTAATLPDGTAATADTFGNGTVYEPVTVAAGSGSTVLNLQTATPYEGSGNAGAPPSPLTVEVFDTSGNRVAVTPTQYVDPGSGRQTNDVSVALPQQAGAPTTYEIVVAQNTAAGAPAAQAGLGFSFILSSNSGGGTGAGGVIDDPAAGSGAGNVFGQKLIPGVNTVGAVFYGESAAFAQQPTAAEAFSSYGPGALQFDGSGNPLPVPQPAGKADFAAPDGTVTTVQGSYGSGFFGTSAAAPNAAAVAALMMQADPALERDPATVSRLLAQSAIPFGNADQTGAGLIQADAAVAAAAALAVCFRAGTRIRVVRGGIECDVAVEDLAVGEMVVTASGAHRPIRWLGSRRLDCRRHPRPREVMPVRVRAHAFGCGRPARDLLVSPGHALCIDLCGEVLIPAGALVDGVAVVQETVDAVGYWHVELDGHDLLLAEDMPAESYLEMGNRGFFAGSAVTPLAAAPDAPAATHADFCRPFHAAGPVVDAVRERLRARGGTAARSAGFPSIPSPTRIDRARA